MTSRLRLELALKGGVNVAGVQARKLVWIHATSLWQSTMVVTTVHVCAAGVGVGVPHPNRKSSPARGRMRNDFFMRKTKKIKDYFLYVHIFSNNSGSAGWKK